MGKGRDIARALSPDDPVHAALEDFRDQLLIVLVKRLADQNGHLTIPVTEADDTGGYLLSFGIIHTARGPAFGLEVRKKQ